MRGDQAAPCTKGECRTKSASKENASLRALAFWSAAVRSAAFVFVVVCGGKAPEKTGAVQKLRLSKRLFHPLSINSRTASVRLTIFSSRVFRSLIRIANSPFPLRSSLAVLAALSS